MATTQTTLIQDGQRLTGATTSGGYDIRVYDDGFGPLWIHRNSMGVSGIVRAQAWEDAYGICEDEFFPEADETVDELIKEYGFRREHEKVINDGTRLRFEVYPDDFGADGRSKYPFVEWKTIETPDPDAWFENELFCEAYGTRPNGPNERDTRNHGIYSKDLNGDSLDLLTPELLADLGITLQIESEDEDAD
jgi:hypothetical protein